MKLSKIHLINFWSQKDFTKGNNTVVKGNSQLNDNNNSVKQNEINNI